MRKINLGQVVDGYIECMLWTEEDNLESANMLAEGVEEAIKFELEIFVNENEELLLESQLDDAQIGHDIWLTRNGHGAGFWDRGLGDVGEALTKACKSLGSAYCYAGDDGLVHI